MDVEHVDLACADERSEADRLALRRRDKGQRTGELLGKRILVIGRSRPGALLARIVVVARELLDAGAENLRQQRRILRQIRP
jgi:hypothetical protein